jgi:L-ascorbate metabolism protein UlaG (beta-lactamase superfamily)
MRITKFGHACVRLEHDGVVVVIDPGVFTEPEAVDGASAVLVTHQHPDHLHSDNLRATDAPIWTIGAVAKALQDDAPDVAERVTVVRPGDGNDVGGPGRAVGEMHAIIHPEFDRLFNSGYLVTLGEQRVYHPGDALTPPGKDIDVLCLPSSAPWLRSQDAIEFARTVKAPRNLAIHDRVYSEAGHGFLEAQMNAFLPKEGMEYIRRHDGADL